MSKKTLIELVSLFCVGFIAFIISYAVNEHNKKVAQNDRIVMAYDGWIKASKIATFHDSDLPHKPDGQIDLSKISQDKDDNFIVDGKILKPIK